MDYFDKRTGTTNKGIEYENLYMTKLILDLILEKDVKNFKISSNDKHFGCFDDVVVEIEMMNGDYQNYAIQLKHKEKGILSESHLTAKQGNFSITKYFEDFQKLKANFDSFKLILYTNSKFDNKDKTSINLDSEDVVVKTVESDIISKDSCYYQFQSTNRTYQDFFDNFYLYTNQLNVDQLRTAISELFKARFKCHDGNICQLFVNFINEWSKKEGRKKKLSKSWMKHVLAMSLLLSSINPICFDGTSLNRKEQLLQEAIFQFEITTFDSKHVEKVKKLWADVKNRNLDLKNLNELARNYQVTTEYIEDITTLTDKQSNKLFWLEDLCPLILTSDTNYQAITLCEGKKFVIMNDNVGNIKNCSIFQKLSDLKDKSQPIYDEIVNNFQCSLQGKEKVSLKELIQNFHGLDSLITTNDLVLMLDDSFLIGEKKEDLSEFYIERPLPKILVDFEYLETIEEGTIVIISNLKTITEFKNCFKTKSIEETSNQDSTVKIYTSQNECSQDNFDQLRERCPHAKKFHQFRAKSVCLEWVRSWGGTSDLNKFTIEESRPDTEFHDYSEVGENRINLLCADPGFGKSTLMKSVKNNSAPTEWTILIYPKDHSKYFREQRHDLDKFMEYILEENYHGSKFVTDFLKIAFQQNRIKFIWDGLDEISQGTLEIVIKVIEALLKRGVKQETV